MENEEGGLDSLIQEKIAEDAEFQESLEELSEEEREEALKLKRAEIIEERYSSLQEEFKKKEELANNYKIRAEKAEKAKKPTPKKGESEEDSKKESDDNLSPKDLYALMNAKVPQEDVDEVIKAAKLLGKTIQEALEDPTVKTILETRGEYRKTAEATNKKTARPSSHSPSSREILEKAEKGEIPEPGTPEAEKLFLARRGR